MTAISLQQKSAMTISSRHSLSSSGPVHGCRVRPWPAELIARTVVAARV